VSGSAELTVEASAEWQANTTNLHEKQETYCLFSSNLVIFAT